MYWLFRQIFNPPYPNGTKVRFYDLDNVMTIEGRSWDNGYIYETEYGYYYEYELTLVKKTRYYIS